MWWDTCSIGFFHCKFSKLNQPQEKVVEISNNQSNKLSASSAFIYITNRESTYAYHWDLLIRLLTTLVVFWFWVVFSLNIHISLPASSQCLWPWPNTELLLELPAEDFLPAAHGEKEKKIKGIDNVEKKWKKKTKCNHYTQ